MDQNVFFFRHVTSLLDTDVKRDEDADSGIEVVQLNENIWKIKTPSEIGIVVHKISLEKIIELQDAIYGELNHRVGCLDEYKKIVDGFRDGSRGFSESEVLQYLHNVRLAEKPDSLMYRAAVDLIFNREYLLTLPEYDLNFFRRFY